MMDLTTNYLGLRLKNPLVAGASPLSRDLGKLRQLEDSGIAAIVMYSLFEEQLRHEQEAYEHFRHVGTDCFAESLTYAPGLSYLPRGADDYLDHVARVKEALDVPVMASLNGSSLGGWLQYAQALQQTGVDAIELNVYHLATDPAQTARDVEDRYVEIVTQLKRNTSVPIALKMSPYFSSLANFATRLDQCGIDGLVLFNRFYQPDIDLEELEVLPDLVLSSPHEMRLPLRWIAILDPLIDANLAASTGVYRAGDVLKLLMAGADAAMLCAALLRHGPSLVTDILSGMVAWMHAHDYVSVRQMQGSMNHRATNNPAAFERANYMKALHGFA